MGRIQQKGGVKNKNKKDAVTIVKGSKKNVPPRDPNGPKLPLSPFLYFCRDWRDRIKEANPDALVPEQNKLLGSKWKELDDEAKKPYHEQARGDKARYDLEIEKYKAKKAATATTATGTDPLAQKDLNSP